MLSSPVASLPRMGGASMNDCLGIPKPGVATVLPADARNAEEFDFPQPV